MSGLRLVTDNGGEIELDEWADGAVWLQITEHNAGGREGFASVQVSREQVAKLRDALTRWLDA